MPANVTQLVCDDRLDLLRPRCRRCPRASAARAAASRSRPGRAAPAERTVTPGDSTPEARSACSPRRGWSPATRNRIEAIVTNPIARWHEREPEPADAQVEEAGTSRTLAVALTKGARIPATIGMIARCSMEAGHVSRLAERDDQRERHEELHRRAEPEPVPHARALRRNASVNRPRPRQTPWIATGDRSPYRAHRHAGRAARRCTRDMAVGTLAGPSSRDRRGSAPTCPRARPGGCRDRRGTCAAAAAARPPAPLPPRA